MGARVILNAAPARPLSQELIELIDLLVVNRVEAAMLSGRPVETQEDATGALSTLGHARCDVIVTLGAGGLVVSARGSAPCFIAATPVKVVSTHGAGDCFIGALGLALARGDALETAAALASRIAARFVSLPEDARETAALHA